MIPIYWRTALQWWWSSEAHILRWHGGKLLSFSLCIVVGVHPQCVAAIFSLSWTLTCGVQTLFFSVGGGGVSKWRVAVRFEHTLRLLIPLFLLFWTGPAPLCMHAIISGLKSTWRRREGGRTRSFSVLVRVCVYVQAPTLFFFLPPANWRQPRCQFHARVVSSAAEIIHCKIDLNNCKVERRGKAAEWNWKSLLPFSPTGFIPEKWPLSRQC